MRKVILSSTEFDKVKEIAMASEPQAMKIRMSDIGFSNLSLTDYIVDIQGKPVSVNREFINKFISLLGLNPKLLTSVKNDESNKKVVTDIINVLNAQKTAQENRELRILISRQNEVIDLVPNEIGGRISNKNYFNIAEQLVDKYGLGIIDTHINKHNGVVALNLVSPNTKVIANLSEETHQFGIKLTNNLYSTDIADFNYRLVCTNGMTALDNYGSMKLQSLNPSDIDKIFNHVKRMADNGFVPAEFEQLMLLAQQTTASIAEVEHGMFSLINRLNLPTDIDKESHDSFVASFINTHFPEYSIRKQQLMVKGYDLTKMDVNDKKFVNGNMSIWDLVNRVTYFASNQQSNFTDTEKLQIIGGGILSTKNHDLASNRIKLLNL